MQTPSAAGLFDLRGMTALVTGASRGIGRTTAMGLASAGADVVVTARDAGDLQEVVQHIESAGSRGYACALDVRDLASIQALFAECTAHGLSLDILVNNAGIERVCPSIDVDEALWDDIVDTNLKGAFFTAQHFARHVLDGGRQASIINLGSLTSAVGVPTATAYTSSKSGVLGMTRALSTEWSPSGIRVNAIGPGYFRTELTEAFYADEAWASSMLDKIPMQRFGDLEDLIGVTVFLASHASAYVTGQIFYVDGGYLASI